MGDSLRLDVNVDDLRKQIRKLADQGLKDELKVANKSAAQIVVDAALPAVPVGATGRLKASVRALGSLKQGTAKAGTGVVDYAAAIHYGRKTGNVGAPPGNHPGPNAITGRMFLWDAAARVRGQVTASYDEAISRLVDKIHD